MSATIQTLFKGPMVRAIIAGTKTQTRRPLYVLRGASINSCFDRRYPPPIGLPPVDMGWTLSRWSKVKEGDTLAVRETWAFSLHAMASAREEDGPFVYEADGPQAAQMRIDGKWRPSIHMPKYVCRLRLPLISTKVERLQNISREDALAEGIVELPCGGYGLPAGEHYHHTDPRMSYWSLWESINGPGSVDADPWVWAGTWSPK